MSKLGKQFALWDLSLLDNDHDIESLRFILQHKLNEPTMYFDHRDVKIGIERTQCTEDNPSPTFPSGIQLNIVERKVIESRLFKNKKIYTAAYDDKLYTEELKKLLRNQMDNDSSLTCLADKGDLFDEVKGIPKYIQELFTVIVAFETNKYQEQTAWKYGVTKMKAKQSGKPVYYYNCYLVEQDVDEPQWIHFEITVPKQLFV